jgi:hypothetical protein
MQCDAMPNVAVADPCGTSPPDASLMIDSTCTRKRRTTTSYIHDSSFLNIFNPSNTSLPRLLDACSIIMPVHHQPHPRCTSAGRVTARTLLSFLALSTPIVASSARQQQDLIPILPPLLSEPETQQPSGRDHVFVSSVTFHTQAHVC